MSKKIGIFLMILLVIWSLLLLDAAKNRSSARPVIRPTEPTASIPPETTAPAAAPTEPADSSRVEAVLDRHTMNRTAVTYLVRAGAAGDSRTAESGRQDAERFFFTAEAEEGSLTNYRLRK